MAKEVTPKTLEEAIEKIASLESEKAEQTEIIADLRKQLASSNKIANAKENIVKCEGKKYKINAKSFHFNGSEVLAEDVKSDSDLLKELVEMEVGFIQEIE